MGKNLRELADDEWTIGGMFMAEGTDARELLLRVFVFGVESGIATAAYNGALMSGENPTDEEMDSIRAMASEVVLEMAKGDQFRDESIQVVDKIAKRFIKEKMLEESE